MQLDLVRRPAGLPVQALTGGHPKGVEQVQNLYRKGFHSEELLLAKQLARKILSDEVPELESQGAFFRPVEEIYDGLLGSDGSQRCALLETFMELSEEAGAARERELSVDPLQSGKMPSLLQLTGEISERFSQLATWAPNILDFQVTSRSPFMLLEAGQSRGDKSKAPKLSNDAMLKWIHIFQRHRFMMLLCLGPEPGSLELRPLAEDAGTHRVQLRPGSLVFLRADCLTHRFSSRGKCFMLTNFLLGPNPQRNAPLASQLQEDLGRHLLKIKESAKNEEEFEAQTSRAIQRIANQNLHKGQQCAVRGCAAREPVAAHDPDAFCSAIMAGIDGGQMVPHLRWDHEQYYSQDPMKDAAGQWKTHCNHGCFMEGLELFDNKMFKISPMEATGMDPNQRQALEVFYETTMSAGLDEKKLMRSNIGVFMGGPGGVNSEFGQVPKDDVGGALGSTSGSAAIMANRISFCMGIHGPNFFIDLEGAASLTAFNLAVDSVQRDKAQCIAAVALGVDCNVHPQGLLTLGWAGLLSRKGRCLSFDSYADGYIRGEGYTGLYVNPLMKEENGKKTIDEDPPIIALASGTFINNNGMCASLTAPSGAMYQELVANCLRNADLSPLDVDAVECQAAGNVLSDAVEATALTRAYRSLAMHEGAEEEMLGLMSAKTNLGNMRPAMGCAALLRVIVGQAMGCMPPSLHLHKMNPHVLAMDEVPSFFVTEPVHHRMVSAFVACTASGIGGSNAHSILWGKACARQVKMENPVQAEDVLTFWPGGGGDLDPICEPRRGCSIVGSWSLMDTPQQMRGEGLDQFSFVVTLGEHGCEWFQIWLDGERERILHPAVPRGLSTAKVQGPHHYRQVATFGWCIDTRPGKTEERYPDEGVPGDQFKVQLVTKGRFRSVTWERLDTQDLQRNGLPKTMGRYFIVGSWNDWQPEEMALEDEVLGRFSIKAVMPKGKQRFQILRNRDWRQMIYPETGYAETPDVAVKGPDGAGHGSYWNVEVEASRNVVLIDLDLWEEDLDADTRKGRSAVSKMKVTWRGIRKQELSEQEVFERSRPSFFLVGSWDSFMRRTKMRFDGLRQCYVGRVPMPVRGSELFQILSNGDWNSILHPGNHEGGMDSAPVRGGGVRGYPSWRLDADDETSARVPQRFEVLLHTKNAFYLQWQPSAQAGEESSDEELDPELYGPPGVLGI
ncbi:unnamed protein product [Durusdinium trenchii]|uniref:Ketosynthase family 3 (KS3) domain-containing protein n=1 Tax=Durusdinium trenchii TaxID=1381693 RepID=A0ABP0PK12_9DINO